MSGPMRGEGEFKDLTPEERATREAELTGEIRDLAGRIDEA